MPPIDADLPDTSTPVVTKTEGHEGPSRDDLIAAADAAIKGEPEPTPETAKETPAAKEAPERGADGKFLPRQAEAKGPAPAAPDKPAEPEKPTDEEENAPALEKILKAREQAQKVREDSQSEAEKIRADARKAAEEEAAKIIAEARRKVDEELGRLRTDPLEAIKRIGWDGQKLVDEVTKEGTPEWRAQKALEAKLAELDAKTKSYDEYVEKQRAAAAQAEAEQRAHRQAQAEKVFLETTASAESCPSLHAMYDADEIIQRTYALAARIRNETGHVASDAELAEYLEHGARKRLEALRQQVGAPAAKQAATQAKAAKTNGSRTLNAANGSERRAAPRPISEMSRDEARAALIAEAEEAMRTAH